MEHWRGGRARTAFARETSALAKLIASGVVADFGTLVHIDNSGRPLGERPARHFRGRAVWRARVERAVQWMMGAMQQNADKGTVYLRGSVALGEAFDNGRSDIDLVFVLDDSSERTQAVEHALRRRALTAPWPCARVRRIDVSVTTKNDILRNPFLLWGFGLRVHGSEDPINDTTDVVAPSNTLAVNIRWDAQRTCRALEARGDSSKLSVWFAKRALRAVMELCSRRVGYYSRDLVPCYRAAITAYPEHGQTWLKLLKLSCGRLDAQDSLAHEIWDFAEVVEELGLRKRYGESASVGQYDLSVLVTNLCPVQEKPNSVGKPFFSNFWRPKSRLPAIFDVIEDPMPATSLKTFRPVNEQGADIKISDGTGRLILNEPTVFRKAVGAFSRDRRHETTFESLFKERGKATVRISPDSTFVFCKEVGENDLMVPLSVTQELEVQEFVLRCSRTGGLPPLFYGSGERVYLQSVVSERKNRVLTNLLPDFACAQHERRWVSTAGSSSSLHFDSSPSALAQLAGYKEFIFFPPEAVPSCGPFPVGHPLGRRARVDLNRPNAALFQEFWTNFAPQASRVVLEPGDVAVWPAGWLHFVTSRTLSFSHTYRFLEQRALGDG